MNRFLARSIVLSGIGAAVLAAAWLLVAATPASAVIWDPNGNLTDGSNFWDTSSLFWYNGLTDQAWVNGTDTAQFGTGTGGSAAYTVTLNTGITVGGITFQNQNYTITGNTLTLGSAATAFNTIANGSIGSILAGSGGLSKTGAGTLTLSGANIYSGTTQVSAGTLVIDSAGSLSNTGIVQVVSGGTLTIDGTVTVADNGAFAVGSGAAGTGTVIVNSGATLNIGNGSGGNAGRTYIGGRLDGTGSVGNGVFIINGGTVNVAAGGPGIGDASHLYLGPWGNNLSPPDELVLNGGTLSTARSIQNGGGAGFAPVIHLNGGTLQAAASLTTGSGALLSSGSGNMTVYVDAGGAIINTQGYNAAIDTPLVHGTGISGGPTDGGLTKLGSGTLTLTAANTYTGGTVVNAGTLQLGSGGSLPIGTAVSLANVSGAIFDVNGHAQTIASLSGGGSTGGNVTLGAGTLIVGDSNNTNYGGAISGTNGSLTKQGGGTLTLSGTSTYTGATNVIAGTLVIATGGSLSNAGNIDTTGGATLNIDGGSVTMASGAAFGVGSGILGTTGTVIVNSGTLTIGVGNSYTAIGGSFPGGAQGVANGTGTLTINGGLVNVGAAGSGTPGWDCSRLWLGPYGGANSVINLNGGTLSTARPIANGGGTPATFNLNGGTLQAAAEGITIVEPVTGLTVNVKAGGAIVDSNNFNTTITSSLLDGGGGGGLTKIGVGTLTLTAASTFTGNTLISNGTLQLGNNLALQNSALDTTGAGTLAFSPGVNTPTFGGLTGANNLTMPVNITALTLNPGTGVTHAYSGNLGSVTAGMTLTKTGAGTQVLSGTNTYTGGTTISVGTLSIGTVGALPGYNTYHGDWTAAGGATLAVQGDGTTGVTDSQISDILTSDNFALGSNLGFDVATTRTYANPIVNTTTNTSLGLVKIGGGTLILSANNTHSGGTKVNAGTLTVASGGSLSGSGVVQAIGSGTLNVAAGGSLSGSSVVKAISGGTMTIEGTVTVADNGAFAVGSGATGTGTVIVNSGATLNIGNGSGGHAGRTYIGGHLDGNGITGNGVFIINGGAVNVAAGSYSPTVGDASHLYLGPWTNTSGNELDLNGGTLSTARGIMNGGGGAPEARPVVRLNGGTLQAAANLPSGPEALLGSYSGDMTVYVDAGGAIINTQGYSAAIDTALIHGTGGPNDGGLTKLGTGTLTLTAANTYNGGTLVSAGMLQATSSSALPGYGTSGKVVVNSNSTLTANTSGWLAADINTLYTTATFDSGSALGIDTTNLDLSYGFALTKAGVGLTKLGTGTLTLTAANTYTGATKVTTGTLTIAAGGSLSGSGVVQAIGGGTLNVAAGGSLSGASVVQPISGGTMTISGTVTVADNGALAVGTGATGTGTVIVNSGGVLNIGNGSGGYAGRTYIGGLLDGTGSGGNGVLTINTGGIVNVAAGGTAAPGTGGDASHFYFNPWVNSGATLNLNGGTLSTARAIQNGGGPPAASVHFNGGTLQAAANLSTSSYALLGSYSGDLAVYVDAGGAIINTQGYNALIDPALVHGSGGPTDGGLTKLGTGTLTLSAASTYTGDTVVQKGTLILSTTGDIADASTIKVYGNGTSYDAVYDVSFNGSQSMQSRDVRSQMAGGSALAGLTASALTLDSIAAQTVSMQWRERNTLESSSLHLISNVLNLGFSSTVPAGYLLAMQYAPSSGSAPYVAWNNSGWINAGTTSKGDHPLTELNPLALALGDYGYDSTTNTAWVVLNHASEFSVVSVPEPTTLAMLAAGLLVLLAYAWRKRK